METIKEKDLLNKSFKDLGFQITQKDDDIYLRNSKNGFKLICEVLGFSVIPTTPFITEGNLKKFIDKFGESPEAIFWFERFEEESEKYKGRLKRISYYGAAAIYYDDKFMAPWDFCEITDERWNQLSEESEQGGEE